MVDAKERTPITNDADSPAQTTYGTWNIMNSGRERTCIDKTNVPITRRCKCRLTKRAQRAIRRQQEKDVLNVLYIGPAYRHEIQDSRPPISRYSRADHSGVESGRRERHRRHSHCGSIPGLSLSISGSLLRRISSSCSICILGSDLVSGCPCEVPSLHSHFDQ